MRLKQCYVSIVFVVESFPGLTQPHISKGIFHISVGAQAARVKIIAASASATELNPAFPPLSLCLVQSKFVGNSSLFTAHSSAEIAKFSHGKQAGGKADEEK